MGRDKYAHTITFAAIAAPAYAPSAKDVSILLYAEAEANWKHRAQPLAIDRTRIVCDWYFHTDAVRATGFDPQPAIDFWDLTNRQDWLLCANAYRGLRSSAWEPGPYSELESQLAAFDRHYLRQLHPLASG